MQKYTVEQRPKEHKTPKNCFQTSMKDVLNLQAQGCRPAGPAASAEPSPQVSGMDLSSQTTRRNGGSTGGNG